MLIPPAAPARPLLLLTVAAAAEASGCWSSEWSGATPEAAAAPTEEEPTVPSAPSVSARTEEPLGSADEEAATPPTGMWPPVVIVSSEMAEEGIGTRRAAPRVEEPEAVWAGADDEWALGVSWTVLCMLCTVCVWCVVLLPLLLLFVVFPNRLLLLPVVVITVPPPIEIAPAWPSAAAEGGPTTTWTTPLRGPDA